MKKLFFTAIAVLAFSGAGFAKGKMVNLKAFRGSCMDRVMAELNAMEAEDGCWSAPTASYWNGFAAAICFKY